MRDAHPGCAHPSEPAHPMKQRMSATLAAALAATAICLVSPAFGYELCKEKDEADRGDNCALDFDSTGRPLMHSLRVIGQVTWATTVPDEYGRHEFVVTWAHFQLRGSSWVKPIVGQSATIVIRSALHVGQIRRR